MQQTATIQLDISDHLDDLRADLARIRRITPAQARALRAKVERARAEADRASGSASKAGSDGCGNV